ncbi:hypothetical protein [Parabacteroides gordonii]|uniref:Major fimbrial subunit protein N-terminal domain-containing protein n=1 Tax=Parabacteroides gordonii MS-1 = DSM 23371 TaxID=1203610 RepID=A0A0F5IWC7_9BACT|nr:hypothetical protein [Parabacteroides gordonii]KKB49525.1 hypothetical protein HMPREF1536_04590 [Parabacteroides gordonii MS-1 = DSM 23371]MCA5585788.1 hypothetical protein [Parabacteroides gordonii]
MNAKNIILAILMVLSFAACSSEIEGIDDNMTNTNVNNGTTSISVRMMTEGVDTKAEANSLTSEDTAINNYIIAVFEHVSKERIGYVRGKNTATGGAVTGLKLEVDTKEGFVDIFVIANLNETDESLFDAIYTSTEFKNQVFGSLDDLVKVGSSIEKEISNVNETVTIELSQLSARVLVNVAETASVNGNEPGEGDVTARINAISYKAKVQNTSSFEPGAVGTPSEATEPIDNNFHFYTYKLNDPSLELNVEIVISTAGKEDVTIEKTISVPFQKDGSLLSVLENGKSYQLTIETALSVSVNCDPTFTYKLHEIETIEQDEITFN